LTKKKHLSGCLVFSIAHFEAMNTKQHTLKEAVTLQGVGLHTGKNATMTFLPAPIGHGIKFKRVDLPQCPVIDADADNVVETSRGTTLAQNGGTVATIEHALAALVGCQIDNVLIEIDGPEAPILDGSALLYVNAFNQVGFLEQDAPRNYFEITETIFTKTKRTKSKLRPCPWTTTD